MRRYETLDHTADIRLRIFGRTFEDLLQNSLFALTDTLTNAEKVKERESRPVRVEAEGHEHLLVLVLKEMKDKILVGELKGEVWKDHPLKTEIKAVTYHGLKIEEKRGRWEVEIILDV